MSHSFAASSEHWMIQPIGYIYSPYKQKFGVARQPGLVPAAHAYIDLSTEFTADCVRGLSDYDYIWVQFVFHATVKDGWQPLIRPPKLGGKEKKGVFATRSPHRPNHLGLSLVKLEQIEYGKQIRLHVSGVDFLDQTPVVDIKPYIPFVEAKPDANCSFAHERELLNVYWSQPALEQLALFSLDSNYYQLVNQSLAQDPRPVHQQHADKIFVMHLFDWDVLFQIKNNMVEVVGLRKHV
ncbi:tRNA (N6-threonylcarbamoyladenosine(37)-N6)-methyltransferase TrmO [Snodgrassella alvi]|uniref:tRNA (N6-threonylcarbamoyladenosine(37)-N6)-methyltransferase TrmO n=1 Tax=Snodgrassella alvi TaxID=1196083 RepID=UPI000C1E1172|nr:tRNA (N6-threonylcarbamoyladenosine(37)-N6)-methyltransferase TrmO [Snodgrassella alvi]